MANGSFQFSATSSDLQRALGAATQKARQQYGSGRVVTQDFVQDPQTGVYTGTIVYEPTPQEEKNATLDAVKRALVEDARASGTVTPTPAPIATQAPALTRESEQAQSPAPVTQPDTVRNVRNNNPGNLRTGDVETAQRYYGKDAVTGVDEGGFAQFGTEGDGINALFQQIRIDSNRINEETGQPQTAEEFIDRYTPVKDDPEGNKAAKINIPKFLGVSLDTPLIDINPRELALAITRQEGGNEALQAFGAGIKGSSAPTLADIERSAANAEKMARESEVETRFGQGSTLAPQDRTVSRDSAMLGMPTQGTTAQQDDELTKRLVGDNIEEQGPQPTGTDVLNVRTDRDRSRFGMPASVVNDMSQNTSLSQPVLNYLQNEADQEVAADTYESQGPPTFMQQGRDVDIIGGESSRSAGADEREPTGGQSVGLTDPRARTAKPVTQTTDTATEPTTDADQQSLLSRIGGLIANNPELTASGFQLLGGLLSNAAQNRAQRRADRTTDQRVARANLISAITGGRARPTVERAQADTGGFMSLDTLGKALQGGGAAVKGELARQVAEDERERKAKLEERGMKASELGVKSLDDYRKATLAFNKKKFDKETQLAAEQNVVDYLKAAKDLNKSERIPIKEIGELSSELASLKRLDNLEDFIVDADFSFLEMGPLRLEEPSQFIFGSDARVAESAIQGLIAEVAKTIPGVLTEGDQKRLETRLLSLNDTESTALDVAQAFREELLVKFEERLGALKESGGFDTTYFDDRLMEYRQGRGAQGFESMLTKDEIVLGG